jgi:hypothetical protein
MLVTEQKAKELVCPVMTLGVILAMAGKLTLTPISGNEPGRCAGSTCMWWRWKERPAQIIRDHIECDPSGVDALKAQGWTILNWSDGLITPTRRFRGAYVERASVGVGFCGMAGVIA